MTRCLEWDSPMRRLLIAAVMIVSAFSPGATYAQAGTAQTRAAAERLMTTIGLEKRVEAITQLYLNFLPTNTPAEQQRATELRQRGPSAGPRFRTAVVNAASSSYTKPELDALDTYFASGEGQRLLTTAVTRAVLGVGSKGGVKSSDILRPEDLPCRPRRRNIPPSRSRRRPSCSANSRRKSC